MLILLDCVVISYYRFNFVVLRDESSVTSEFLCSTTNKGNKQRTTYLFRYVYGNNLVLLVVRY
jgi:hypothetical protein